MRKSKQELEQIKLNKQLELIEHAADLIVNADFSKEFENREGTKFNITLKFNSGLELKTYYCDGYEYCYTTLSLGDFKLHLSEFKSRNKPRSFSIIEHEFCELAQYYINNRELDKIQAEIDELENFKARIEAV